MQSNISSLSDWLMSQPRVTTDKETGWSSIASSVKGMFGDLLDIYFKEERGEVTLSDDGDLLNNAELEGFDANSPLMRTLLNEIITKWGVCLSESHELTKIVDSLSFSQGKYEFLSAMMEISDLVTNGTQNNLHTFRSHVDGYLKECGLDVIPDVAVRGLSGLNFTFDYMLSQPKSEYVIQSFNQINDGALASFYFGLDDVMRLRTKRVGKSVHGIAIVNDLNSRIMPEYLRAFESRNVKCILWSKRRESLVLA